MDLNAFSFGGLAVVALLLTSLLEVVSPDCAFRGWAYAAAR